MPAYNVTVRLVDSAGTIIGGVASAIMAAYNATFRVVDSNGLVIDSFGGGSSALTPHVLTITDSPKTLTGTAQFYAISASAGADFIANLPAATGSGNFIIVKKMDAGAHNVVVTCAGGDLLDGLPTYTLGPVQFPAIWIVDGAAAVWSIIGVKP